MMRTRYLLIWIGLIVGIGGSLGCAHKKVQLLPLRQMNPNERIFPTGVYKHEVGILIAKTSRSPEIKFDFNGVVRLKPEMIQMVALSHFGTTIFRVTEDLKTGEIKTEVFISQMKKFESKIPQYYNILRLFLLARFNAPSLATDKLKWSKTGPQGLPLQAETLGFDKNAVFDFEKYDPNSIPTEIMIHHPDFTVEVKVNDYEI